MAGRSDDATPGGADDPTPGDLLERARERERAQSLADRRAAGQFSTPVPIARTLVDWAVRRHAGSAVEGGALPRVLDPSTGGGVFALAAVERLRSLSEDEDGAPAARATAVESDPEALAQAASHLPTGVRTVEANFLDCGPDDLGRFDAVVGNPPYVRQELVAEDARDHLAAFGSDGETPYRDGEAAIDRRSDAYVYFLTNATRLLREGGRLGMVVPTKWLDTRYGETLQRFLLDHYDVHAVVGFDGQAFDEALVDAALLCCERTSDSGAPTRFCRVAAGTGAALRAAANGTDGSHRELAVERSELEAHAPGKLGHLLDAPPGVVDLLSADALVPLGDLATPAYGQKTGANDAFFDPAVDERFRAPAVTSFQDVAGLTLDEAPAMVLDVHDYVERVADGETPVDPAAHEDLAAATLAAMHAEGYGRTADYVRANDEYAERTTCASRRVWFDLGPLDHPPVLHPKFFDRRVSVVHNRAGCVPSNAIDCLQVDGDVPVDALLGALNSTLHAVMLECWGRSEGGGALQLMTYELERVPVLDVRDLDEPTCDHLGAAFRSLAAGDPGARDRIDRTAARDRIDRTAARDRIDRTVLDALGTDRSLADLRSMRSTLADRRTGE